jgi:hypothetical protein
LTGCANPVGRGIFICSLRRATEVERAAPAGCKAGSETLTEYCEHLRRRERPLQLRLCYACAGLMNLEPNGVCKNWFRASLPALLASSQKRTERATLPRKGPPRVGVPNCTGLVPRSDVSRRHATKKSSQLSAAAACLIASANVARNHVRSNGDRSETTGSPSLRREHNRSLSRQRPELVPAVVLNMGIGDLHRQPALERRRRGSGASLATTSSKQLLLDGAHRGEISEGHRSMQPVCSVHFCSDAPPLLAWHRPVEG